MGHSEGTQPKSILRRPWVSGLAVLAVLSLFVPAAHASSPTTSLPVPTMATVATYDAARGDVFASFDGRLAAGASRGHVGVFRTWPRNGFDHVVMETAIEPLPVPTIDITTGSVQVSGSVRSVVTHEVIRSQGGELVSSSRRPGTIAFQLTWTQGGAPSVMPSLPGYCLLCPPRPPDANQPAKVDGRIRFGGIEQTFSLAGSPGTLSWGT